METGNPPPPASQTADAPTETVDSEAILCAVAQQRDALMVVSSVLKCSRFTLLNDPMEEVCPTEHSDVIAMAIGLLSGTIAKLDSVQLAKDAAR